MASDLNVKQRSYAGSFRNTSGEDRRARSGETCRTPNSTVGPRPVISLGRDQSRRARQFDTGHRGHSFNYTKALETRLVKLERMFRGLSRQQAWAHTQWRRMKTNLVTMAIISRRVSEDGHAIDKQIKALDKRIKVLENNKELKDDDSKDDNSKDESKDTVDYRLAKDARIKVIGEAIRSLKSSLSWGKFYGAANELDELFQEVEQLL